MENGKLQLTEFNIKKGKLCLCHAVPCESLIRVGCSFESVNELWGIFFSLFKEASEYFKHLRKPEEALTSAN